MTIESSLNGINPGKDGAPGLLSFVRSIRKHWPSVLAFVILAAGLTLVYSKSQTRFYQASATIEFDLRAIRPLADKESLRDSETYWDNREYYDTQIKVVTSDRVLTRVARDVGLMSDADFLGVKTLPNPLPTAEDVAATLRARLTVEPVKNTRLALIQYEDSDPKRARRLCDAVANAFVDQNLEKTINASGDAVVWLNGQVDHYRGELANNENALHDFKERNELSSTSINEASNMIRLEMQEFDTALTRTRTKKQELIARSAELSKIQDDSAAELPASELLSSAFLQNLRGQYLDAVKERSSLIAEGKGDNHPLVKRATERASEAKAALLAEVKNIKGSVDRDLAIVAREEAGEQGLFDGARQRAVDLNMKEIEYHRLDRAREENEKIYAMLLERMKAADLSRMMNVNDVRVVDPPTLPKMPVRPRVAFNVAIGMFLGLFFGVAFAVVREQLDSTLKTPEDVEQRLGLTFMGLLPEVDGEDDQKKRKRRRSRRGAGPDLQPELIVHYLPRGALAEAARTVRTNLLFTNPDKPLRVLLVSSAAPSEGKTTVACSIAIALAQGGQRVCIVDCDLRRPRLHRIFERTGSAGVTNYLVGEVTLDDIAKPSLIDNLDCIPAGPIPPNPADMLQSERFRKFLRELSERYDRVIVDSPPLAAVTDGAIISTFVDGTVFVIRAFKTTLALSRQGLRALADVDAPVAGAVLNAVNFNRDEYKYYQYYYYKREGYAPHPPSAGVADDGEDEGRSAPPN